MKVLVFDIWGDYGHFRKFYTTSSPLTFSFPPPSTIAGILGAIFGASKDEYLKIFSLTKCRIALKIVKPIKKVRMGLNFINTKGNYWTPILRITPKSTHEPRTQIRTEFLKDPYFRIYFIHEDETILFRLAKFVEEHNSIYTISLGLSELLADFKFIGIYNTEKILNGAAVEIYTPIVASNLTPNRFEIEPEKKYFKEKIPIIMNPERIIEKYNDVIFESQGKTIKAQLNTYYKLENGENIAFF
ncbi:MAG: type I-B CRISPR-associated protein Cas5b [Candidatus Methanoperedens sp.]|nr:type I-B CRISPR-associated protein Cas5b [Candidatus Methanoperedens sp.]